MLDYSLYVQDGNGVHARKRLVKEHEQRVGGERSGDLDAAAQSVAALSSLAEAEAAALEELDVNPLIVTRSGAFAADALVRIRKP